MATPASTLDVASIPSPPSRPSAAGLTSLRIFFALGNKFEAIPAVMGTLPRCTCRVVLQVEPADARRRRAPSVEWLILTDNQLTALPKSIGKLSGLKKCMLAANRRELASLFAASSS